MSLVYFISDVHLGASPLEKETRKEKMLLSLLAHIQENHGELVIVGDLFDFWFEYKNAIPRLHFRVLAKLAELAGENPIHYLSGNHDFWLGSFMQEIGFVLHADEWITTIDGKKVFLQHGDGLLGNDHGYRFLKRVLRNKVNIFLYKMLHPDIGIPLALSFSNMSRAAGDKKKHVYRDDDYRDFAFKKIDQGYDYVVLGHTHWEAAEQHQNGMYLNPGFFGNNYTFLVLQDGCPSVLQWDGEKGNPVTLTYPPGNK